MFITIGAYMVSVCIAFAAGYFTKYLKDKGFFTKVYQYIKKKNEKKSE